MRSYTIHEISQMLADRCLDVCELLLPNGRRNGAEWCVGNIDGEAGQSLRVHIGGDKSGVWKDFASDAGGDLIDLIMAVKDCTKVQAVKAAEEFLGIKSEPPKFTKVEHSYKAPEKPRGMVNVSGELMGWFNARGISEQTVRDFKVGMIVAPGKAPVMVFPYFVEGKLTFLKYRPMGNKHGMWTSKDSRPCLYGWQCFPENSRSVVIVEGELDAMALHEAGVAALSVPRGGGDGDKQDGWLEEEYERLRLFDHVYLALDMDEQGRKAAKQIADRLGGYRCLWVDFSPYKDANEALMNGMDISLSGEVWKKAKTIDPDELSNAADYEQAIFDYLSDTQMTLGEAFPWAKTEGKIGLRPGETTVWAGINGHGKSQLVGHVAVDSMSKGHRWCIASMEFKPHKLLARMCRQITGISQPQSDPVWQRCMDFLRGHCWMFDVQGTAKADALIDVFEYAYRRYGVDNFLVDSLAKCGLGEDDYNGQKKFVDRLSDFARDHGVNVHLVCHSRKGQSESDIPDKLDIKGTGSITDMVDNVYIVWRNKPKEEAQQKGDESRNEEADCILNCCKQREGEWEGKTRLWFDRASLQYLEFENDGPVRYC